MWKRTLFHWHTNVKSRDDAKINFQAGYDLASPVEKTQEQTFGSCEKKG